MLAVIPPMLPSLVNEPPEGGGWIHEIKYDGYRTQFIIEDGKVRAFTRNGHDWSGRYRPLIAAAHALPCRSAIIDGEVIVQDEQGRSDFHSLKATIHRAPDRLAFMAFDLLHLDGDDLRNQPLSARRGALAQLLGQNRPESPFQFSTHLEGSGADFLAAVDQLGLEGIVSKKSASRYRSGRTKAWLKTKTFEESEFVVVGVEREPGKPSIALLARETDHGLEYAGGAAITLREAERDRFWRSVEKLATKRPALPMTREGKWIEPKLKVGARYLRNEPKLRHSTLTGLK